MVFLCFYLSRPSCPCSGLDGGRGDRPGQVLGVVAGNGKDGPLLSGDVYLVPVRLMEASMGMMMS